MSLFNNNLLIPQIEPSTATFVLDTVAFLVDSTRCLARIAFDNCVIVSQSIELILSQLETIKFVALLVIIFVQAVLVLIIVIFVVVVIVFATIFVLGLCYCRRS